MNCWTYQNSPISSIFPISREVSRKLYASFSIFNNVFRRINNAAVFVKNLNFTDLGPLIILVSAFNSSKFGEINLVPKNAVGTAAGFVGLCGYAFGSAVLANILMGFVAEHAGWNATFILLSAASVIALVLCTLTLPSENTNR